MPCSHDKSKIKKNNKKQHPPFPCISLYFKTAKIVFALIEKNNKTHAAQQTFGIIINRLKDCPSEPHLCYQDLSNGEILN